METKRKRVVVSIETKLNAIERIERGELARKVAADLKVGKSTVIEWVKSKEMLNNYAARPGRRDSNCKVMKRSPYEELNEALFVWFMQQRNKGAPLSGPIIKQQAKLFASKLGDTYKNFTACNGWLGKWQNRYGIRQLVSSGEISADESAVKEFRKQFMELTENLTRDQIFNCDEMELNYKTLPTRSEKVMPYSKSSKERITVLLCSNASGEFRLPLMCIGKFQKHQSLNNISANTLPVYYKHQKNAWMSVDLFQGWFRIQFVPKVVSYLKMKELPPKAILFLDNAPSHPDLGLLKSGDITAYFFPSNVCHIIQPINQGVSEAFKNNYKRLMLQFVVSSEYDSLLRNIEAINIKNAIYWAADAWNRISNATLKNAWRNIYQEPLEEENDEKPELTKLVRQVHGCENMNESEVNEWTKSENDCEMNIDEILEVVLTEPKSEESEEDCLPDRISPEEGIQALNVALKYIEQHQASTPRDIMLIKHWRDIADQERISSKIKKENN